jgi:translation initiation factor 2A
MNILERGPDGATLHVHGADAVLGEHPLGNVATVQTLFSVDGRFLATVNGDHVSIYDTGTNNVVRMIPTPGTIAVHFSPTAKFLIVYQKANAAGAGEEKNLTVWNTESGEKLYSCFQKSFNKSEWPYIQFSDDDSIACRVVNNEVHFLKCCDFVAPACRLRVPNVAAAKLSPGVVPTLAAFVPEIKGQPGSVRLYSPPSDNSEGAIESPPLARRSFFRVQEVEFSWARNGVAVLVLGSSEVDATNQSYYGESSLHFMRTDGELDCKVNYNTYFWEFIRATTNDV